MANVIATYETGGKRYTITEDRHGNIERNGCPVLRNFRGRRYVLTTRKKKRYLCEQEGCYKNATVGSLCKDHSPDYVEPEKPKAGATDPWEAFRAAQEQKNTSKPIAVPQRPGQANWEDFDADDEWW